MSTGTKRETKKTERMCITVPKRIKRKMNRFQSSNIVNWSEIASKAFSRHIRKTEREEG